MRQRITILGSTGSIGVQALDVVRRYPDNFELVGLSALSNAGTLYEQAAEFFPEYVALESANASLAENLASKAITGPGASERLSEIPADVVLNGIVGFAGLSATVAALKAGNRVALANKESLVAGGEWVMNLAKNNRIIPVDSEHSAIFQCLEGRSGVEIEQILLTASGGPFFGWDEPEIAVAEPEDALQHPTWRMGPKITVDSATMMNKGLEVIEAHHLFGIPYEKVRVVVHRQSMVHGGVILADGSVVMHAATPDMRLPISYAILYPDRVDVGAEPVSFGNENWTFEEPRSEIFRCLPLAMEAGRSGGAYTVVLNASNEVAVQAFLDRRIKFTRIATLIEEVLQNVPEFGRMDNMIAIREADVWARQRARALAEGDLH